MKTKMKKTIYTLIAMLGFANLTMAQVPNYVPTNGIVGYWPFNGNANDASGNGNNGTVNGGALLANDRFGIANKAYNFDGIDDYINTSLVQGTISSYSISCWIKTSNTIMNSCSGGGSIVQSRGPSVQRNGKSLSISIGESSQPRILAGINGEGLLYSKSTTNNYADGIWHHVACTWSSTVGVVLSSNDVLLYIDGILISNTNAFNYDAFGPTNSPINSTYNTLFGKFDGCNPSKFYSGFIDDIGIWNRALTQAEITALYSATDCDTITNQPTNQTVNINANASFIVATTDSLATYQWQTDLGMGFQNISSAGQYNGATNDTLVVSNTSINNNNQNFRCIVSSGNCKDTSTTVKLTVNNNTGINSPSNVNAIKVYPNPASTILYIDLEKQGYYIAKLSSVAGQSIVSPTTGTVDISALANGVYILTIYDSNNKLISTNKVAIVK